MATKFDLKINQSSEAQETTLGTLRTIASTWVGTRLYMRVGGRGGALIGISKREFMRNTCAGDCRRVTVKVYGEPVVLPSGKKWSTLGIFIQES